MVYFCGMCAMIELRYNPETFRLKIIKHLILISGQEDWYM